MAKVIWNGTVIAESDRIIKVEGRNYFPHTAVKPNYFIESDRHSVCPIKGTANYYHIEVNGNRANDAAYYFPNPNPRVKNIQNYIGFSDNMQIED
jgi:uncharacterized protein (DUF427 family)